MADRIEIPRLSTLSRHASRHVIEASLIPLALFYGALVLSGKSTALVLALGWSYLAIGRRLVRGRRVPGVLLLGAFGLTARTVVAFGTGSLFLYFLQPTLTNVAVAGIFLASLGSGTPMVERLASDFCPLPEPIQAPVRRYFNGATVLWAGVQLANAGLTIGLLMSQPVHTYVWARSVSSWVITGSAIAVSTVWFKQSMRRSGILVVHA
ncbi:MAG TPA: VC0807 family protein [Acidimicrobiales bacterium]|nr:VC0807 family protein [Acidimicrobiales bacterium]